MLCKCFHVNHIHTHTGTHTPFSEWVSASHTLQKCPVAPISARVLTIHHQNSSGRDHLHSLPLIVVFPLRMCSLRSGRLSPKIGQCPRSPHTNRRPEAWAGGGDRPLLSARASRHLPQGADAWQQLLPLFLPLTPPVSGWGRGWR